LDMGAISAIVIVILIFFAGVLGFILAYFIARFNFEMKLGKFKQESEKKQQSDIEVARKEAIAQSRGVLGGKFIEQVVPYLPDFKYDPTEARFIGSPIDLIVFPGLATGEPKEIVIIEIKSGKTPHLTASEAKIRELIENGMVRWELIQRPAEKGS
jgi:predicted Holliday junction resolvase-like endonuclease